MYSSMSIGYCDHPTHARFAVEWIFIRETGTTRIIFITFDLSHLSPWKAVQTNGFADSIAQIVFIVNIARKVHEYLFTAFK